MSTYTDAELAEMDETERALAVWFESLDDPEKIDNRYGDLPYDEVVDASGDPVIGPSVMSVRGVQVEHRVAAEAIAAVRPGVIIDMSEFRQQLEQKGHDDDA